MEVPSALVRGCNNPVGLNPLSDWIEEQSGIAPDFFGSGFSDDPRSDSLNGRYYPNGNGRGDGPEDYGFFDGRGLGHGSDYGSSSLLYGDGVGYGRGSDQTSYGDLYGDGVGDSR